MPTKISDRWLNRGIIVLAIGGALASGVLLASHDGGWQTAGTSGTGYLANLCHPPSIPSANCADVVGSRWGALDFRIGSRRWVVPLSFLGFAYFLTMAVWFTFTGATTGVSRLERYGPVSTGLLGIVASCGLIGVMAFVIRSWCPLCVIAHLANFGMVALILARAWRDDADPSQPVDFGGRRANAGMHIQLARLAVLTSLCAVGCGWMLFDRTIELRREWRKAHALRKAIATMQEDETLMLYSFLAEPVHEVPAVADGHLIDQPRIVLFLDAESPSSRCFESAWRERYSPAVGDAIPVEVRHLNDEASRTLASAFDVRLAPAAVVDGRRVPDLCLRSDAFWTVVGRRPAVLREAGDLLAMLSKHAATSTSSSEAVLP